MPSVGSNERPGLPLAVVVGAGGMGMAIARRLGQDYRLLLVDRNATHLELQLAALHAEGHLATGGVCDITNEADVARLAGNVAQLGGFRALAHVAGLSPSMGDWASIMSVNLVGAAMVEQALQPHAGSGTAAVFISSLAAQIPPPAPELLALLDKPLAPDFLSALRAGLGEAATSSVAYQHSKFALNRLCARGAARWGRAGARIMSLSPGLIATPMGALEFSRQPMKYRMLENTPLQREGTMIEIADAVEFLLSSKASFISGIDLLVDGGLAASMRLDL
jgi:NAD(P)-dependent dehydrogenase (short-subunit alcohol dehydrogenase family)